MLSAIIITHNEENNIADCLKSVCFADEIIVVDSGSTDETVKIAQTFTKQIFITSEWPGFGAQKNFALSKASGDWVLSIDADERVTDSLQKEIIAIMADKTYQAHHIPRQSSYCGRWIKHSGWSPDYVLRLFRKEYAHFSNDIVHEKVIFSEALTSSTSAANTTSTKAASHQVSYLKNPLLHYSFSSVEEVLDKVNKYSSANAQLHYEKGKKSSLTKAILHGFWAFFRSYFLRLGFLDGREGFILAISNAEGTYYRYIKLIYLIEKHENSSPNNLPLKP